MGTLLKSLLGLFVLSMATGGCASLNPNTEAQLREGLEAHREAYQACYAAALERDRNVKGDVDLVVELEAEATELSAVAVEETDIEDEDLGQCIADAAEGTILPEPPGVPVEGHYRVNLQYTP